MKLKPRVSLVWGIICLLITLTGCQPAAMPQGDWVKVSRVVSGQTLEVIDPRGQTTIAERVRLLGVDAPAWTQEPWQTYAKERLEQLLGEDKAVLLESDIEKQVESQDQTTLRLAYLWKNNELLNEKLVEEGWVLAIGRSPNTKYEARLTRAQEKARLLGIGIWNPKNPMRQTPDEFIRSQKSGVRSQELVR
jgi:micrococcal nuclease